MDRWLRQYVGVDRLMPRGEYYYVHLALAWKLTWKQYYYVHRTVLCTSQLELTCEQGYVCELIICPYIEHKNSNLINKHLKSCHCHHQYLGYHEKYHSDQSLQKVVNQNC